MEIALSIIAGVSVGLLFLAQRLIITRLRRELAASRTELRTCRETFVYDMEVAEAMDEARDRVKQ